MTDTNAATAHKGRECPDEQEFVNTESEIAPQAGANVFAASAPDVMLANAPDAERAAGIPFIERRRGQCSFPLWGHDRRIGSVCGESVEPESTLEFCRAHRALCFVRG